MVAAMSPEAMNFSWLDTEKIMKSQASHQDLRKT